MSGWSSLMRQTAVVCGLLAMALGVVLMAVKYQVQALEDELTRLNDRVIFERQSIHVLRAEFSYLTESERLRRLATQHLGLVPIAPGQLGTFADLGAPHADSEVGLVAGDGGPVLRPAVGSGGRR